MDITLQTLSISSPDAVRGVQLVQRGDQLELLILSDRPELAVVKLPPGPGKVEPRHVMHLDTGPLSPAWDARPVGSDPSAYAAVYTRPGSAIGWVLWQGPGATEGVRMHSETFAIYLTPRFVKGQGAGQSITSILLDEDWSRVRLFTQTEAGGFSFGQPLGEPLKSLTDARLLSDSSGYWLFLLMRVPGTIPAPVERAVGTGDRLPGLLHALRLDRNFKVTGQLFRIFGTQPVYEFDVDPGINSQVAVFATTPAGAILGFGALGDQPMTSEAWKETAFESPVSSPSVLVRDSVAHLAAIRNLGGGGAAVLYGDVRLQ